MKYSEVELAFAMLRKLALLWRSDCARLVKTNEFCSHLTYCADQLTVRSNWLEDAMKDIDGTMPFIYNNSLWKKPTTTDDEGKPS